MSYPLQFSYIHQQDEKPKLTKNALNKTRKKQNANVISKEDIEEIQKEMTNQDDDDDEESNSNIHEKTIHFTPPPLPEPSLLQGEPKSTGSSLNSSQKILSSSSNNIQMQNPMSTQVENETDDVKIQQYQEHIPVAYPNIEQQQQMFQQQYQHHHGYSRENGPSAMSSNIVSSLYEDKDLTKRLNYMIHLLEDQKDQKTGSVVEELVLYGFFGIFIIFVIDSFVRVGQYTR